MKADIKYNNKTGADIRQRQIVENCGRSAGRGNCAGGGRSGEKCPAGTNCPVGNCPGEMLEDCPKNVLRRFPGDITEIVRGEIVHVRLRHSDHIHNRLLAAYKYYI